MSGKRFDMPGLATPPGASCDLEIVRAAARISGTPLPPDFEAVCEKSKWQVQSLVNDLAAGRLKAPRPSIGELSPNVQSDFGRFSVKSSLDTILSDFFRKQNEK